MILLAFFLGIVLSVAVGTLLASVGDLHTSSHAPAERKARLTAVASLFVMLAVLVGILCIARYAP